MDIEQFVKEKAPDVDAKGPIGEHDRAYARALRGAYEVYKDMDLAELKTWQAVTRQRASGPYLVTHEIHGALMVLFELIKEKEPSA